MQAIILAAGSGKRLSSAHSDPKALLKIGEFSLLERHIASLVEINVTSVVICVGYQHELIIDEVEKLGLKNIKIICNNDFHLGSTVSLWKTREVSLKQCETLLLDADVLYHPQILKVLTKSKLSNCVLIDRNFEAGDEPVKVCIHRGKITEFRKTLPSNLKYDTMGESVGFFKFSGKGLETIYDTCEKYINSGKEDKPHEEVIRDCIIYDKMDIGYEDITGLPWIEIDFPEDIEKAKRQVLPKMPITEPIK